MSPNQPDFVFADEENGVVALKNGDEIFYTSLYWRALNAVNFLARVHYLTPRFDRIATVRQDELFEPSGLFYTRPDDVNMPWAPWVPRYPGDLHSAHAGEELPIARIPAGIAHKPGDTSPYAGRADFYRLRYGPYLIGMNTTKAKTFDLGLSARGKTARDLVSGKTLSLGSPVRVGPMSTVVLLVAGDVAMAPFKSTSAAPTSR